MVSRGASTLLGLSIALLVAAVLGVQLGRSAIAQINPIHFQGAAPRPAGIDPNAAAPPADGYALAYGWNQGYAARAEACGGDCAARESRDALAFAEPASVQKLAAPAWRDVTPTDEPPPWAPGETGGRRLSVERYMHYPIEAEAEAEDAPAPAPAEEKSPAYESEEDE